MTTDLSVTLLLQGNTTADQIGYDRAFQRLVEAGVLSGYRAFPYRPARTAAAWQQLWHEVVRYMRHSGSNVLFLQFFHGAGLPDPLPYLRQVAALPQRPLVATSCGDGFGPLLRPAPKVLGNAARGSDVTFCSSMGRLADRLAQQGAQRVTLTPLGACDVRFGGPSVTPPDESREFDVVFVGNRPRLRNPARASYWSGRERARYVEAFAKRYGTRFAVFGRGWDSLSSSHGPVSYAEQALASQRGRIVIGGYPGSKCDYYLSDRPFVAAISGTPLVDLSVPRVDRLLCDGSEWALAQDLGSTFRKADALLEMDSQTREALGKAGAQAVRARHMVSHRVDYMVTVLEEIRRAKAAGRVARLPPMPFFHRGVDPAAEARYASRNW